MKVVLLAGGLGTRISEETINKPKPMVEIGGKPILWHIMKIFSFYGYNEFIVCCGYKGHQIKEYFLNYRSHNSDLTIDISKNSVQLKNNKVSENWKISLIDTGLDTMTGGRIKRISKYLENDDDFFLTYGDGLANVNINKLLKFHKKHKKIATITAVQPVGRYGSLEIVKNNTVNSFFEKPKGDRNWINGGFFILNKKVMNFINGDKEIFEKKPLENLAKKKQLIAYKHNGFWKAMDTLNDRNYLEELISKNKAPWKIW